MTCCGKPLLTPFCPFCGKPTNDPALELVHYINAKITNYRTQARRAENSRHGRDERTAQTCTNKADQMQTWVDRILELTGTQTCQQS